MTAGITRYIDDSIANLAILKTQAPDIAAAGQMLVDTLHGGGKIILCGNGGSAADAQHLAAEMMGRFLRDRDPLPALALTVDSSALTAIANDYDFETVFSRQLLGIGRAGDVLVAISTSGNSANVLQALETAKRVGIQTVGLTGAGGGRMAELCDVCLRVPADSVNHIQEMHILIGHILCAIVEEAVMTEPAG